MTKKQATEKANPLEALEYDLEQLEGQAGFLRARLEAEREVLKTVAGRRRNQAKRIADVAACYDSSDNNVEALIGEEIERHGNAYLTRLERLSPEARWQELHELTGNDDIGDDGPPYCEEAGEPPYWPK
jgi:hypothetical protein